MTDTGISLPMVTKSTGRPWWLLGLPAAEAHGLGVGGLVRLAAPDAADLEVGLADQHAVGTLVELLDVLEADAAADQHRQLDRLLHRVEPLPRGRDRAARAGHDHRVDPTALGEILRCVLDRN